jgi:hypothetical protein
MVRDVGAAQYLRALNAAPCRAGRRARARRRFLRADGDHCRFGFQMQNDFRKSLD